jgi:recombination protein RecT
MANEKTGAAATTALAKNPVGEKLIAGKNNLVARLPAGIDKERFFLGIMTAIQRSKATAPPGKSLAECDPNSVLLAAYDAAECGCSLSPSLAQGWLIPYGRECNFQPSYRFFIQKAYETKEVKTFFAEVVYGGDQFIREFAPKRNLFHAIGTGERIKLNALGAYAFIEFTDGTQDWEYLTAEQINRHREHSKQPNSMKWVKFWEEGWRITPIRVLAKRLPLKNRDLEGLVEMINKDTMNEGIITTEEIEDIAAPRRTEEAQPQTHVQQSAPNETAKPQQAQATVQHGGEAAPASGSMFQEEAFLTPAQVKEFWDKAVELGWKKEDVAKALQKKFNVTAVNDLRGVQFAEAMSILGQD